MAKYIDLEKLDLNLDAHGGMNGVLFVSGGRTGGKTAQMVQAALKRMIENAEVVDAVKVVRCWRCIWRDKEESCTNPKCSKSFYGTPVPDMHFCSYGEEADA